MPATDNDNNNNNNKLKTTISRNANNAYHSHIFYMHFFQLYYHFSEMSYASAALWCNRDQIRWDNSVILALNSIRILEYKHILQYYIRARPADEPVDMIDANEDDHYT